MALLTKDQILSADRKKSKDVKVPEWGGSVRFRSCRPAIAISGNRSRSRSRPTARARSSTPSMLAHA